jgi:hypothetical protein
MNTSIDTMKMINANNAGALGPKAVANVFSPASLSESTSIMVVIACIAEIHKVPRKT